MDVSIVGGGLFGLAAALECAQRGHHVTLHEADAIPAALASSHDVSKALRHTYGAKCPLYAPLVAEAIGRWRTLERVSGRTLFHQVGFAAFATHFAPGSFEFDTARELAGLGLAHEVIEGRDAARRFPAIACDGVAAVLLDPAGGWLEPDECLLALRDAAIRAGATIREHESISDPARLPGDRVLVTAGPWLSKLMPGVRPAITPTLQHEWFFAAERATDLPVWSFDIATLGFYGFPRAPAGIHGDLHKVATHCHGRVSDPDHPRDRDDADRVRTEEFVRERLPFLRPTVADHRGCFYANTLDGNFLFAPVAGSPRLCVAGGGSGHAFKFGPVLGRFAADLVEDRPIPREFRLEREAGRTV